jgi:hypothetical protein
MFLVSVPAWWLFEFFNGHVGNWRYIGVGDFSWPERVLHSNMSFATVIPAVFTTAELWAGTRLAAGAKDRIRPKFSPRVYAALICLGLVLLAAVFAIPRLAYPAVWLAVFFVLDPVNRLLGWPSILGQIERGDWRTVVHLSAAALTCGLLWEMWNINASPKWVYAIPLFGRGEMLELPYVFEMPLLGYLGYIPFGLELYALYQFVTGLLGFERGRKLAFDHDSTTSEAPSLNQAAPVG